MKTNATGQSSLRSLQAIYENLALPASKEPGILRLGRSPSHGAWRQLTSIAALKAEVHCNTGHSLNNTGLGKLPFFDFPANQAWANIAALAFNLVSWLQLAALSDGHHAIAWENKRWRYRIFATAGKIITRARHHQLLLPEPALEKDLLALLLENNVRLNEGRVPSTG
jgi:hypothetical protein